MATIVEMVEQQLPESFAVGYVAGFSIAALIYAIRAAVKFFVRIVHGRD